MVALKSQPPLPSPVGQSPSVRGTAGDAMGVWAPRAGRAPTEGQCGASAPQRAVLATGGPPADPGPALRPLTPPAQPGPRPHTTDTLGHARTHSVTPRREAEAPGGRFHCPRGGRWSGRGGFHITRWTPGDQEAPEQGGNCSPSSSPSPQGAWPVRALPTPLLPSPRSGSSNLSSRDSRDASVQGLP